MSTGKRLAKRSILGTRVASLGIDGYYYPGMIQAMKTQEDGGIGGGVMPNRYSVRFDDGRRVVEFLEKDIIGPGFEAIGSVQLQVGQTVYVTHCQREIRGIVVRHDFETQDVIIKINEDETLLKNIDEVRLLESRKSARLVNSDTDFSKLADVNISSNGGRDMERRKFARGTGAIEVPKTDYVQISGSRKRRTSENMMDADDNETMTECSAAMLLMKLSCSPASAGQMGNFMPSTAAPHFTNPDRPPSVDSSSGASSFRSSTPSPPLSSSATTDEGIIKDFPLEHARVTYQCTYPGCRDQRASVRGIESHVRKEHLMKEDPERLLEEGEEEFYYTEVENPIHSQPLQFFSPQQFNTTINSNGFSFGSTKEKPPGIFAPSRARSYSSSDSTSSAKQLATLSLADHLDMARPAHEDPGRGAIVISTNFNSSSVARAPRSILVPSSRHSSGGSNNSSSLLMRSPDPITMPITIAPSAGSPGKYILISPPSQRTDSSHPIASSAPSASTIKSPTRRVREGKKCRKVYGLEQRDLWCTQCKWKKACARFGSNAIGTNASTSIGTTSSINTSPGAIQNILNLSKSPNNDSTILSTSSPAGSLLMAAASSTCLTPTGNAATRAIKF